MTRNCVALLLIPFALLSQGVWPAHSHGEGAIAQYRYHSLAPHVHPGSLVCKSAHRHGGNARGQNDFGNDLSDDPIDEGTLPNTHDSDAVYLSATDSVAGRAAPSPDVG